MRERRKSVDKEMLENLYITQELTAMKQAEKREGKFRVVEQATPTYRKQLFDAVSPFGRVKVITYSTDNQPLFMSVDGVYIINTNEVHQSFYESPRRELIENQKKNLDVLYFGLGLGIGISVFVDSSKVSSIDVVEINEEIVSACSIIENPFRYILKSEKVNVVIADGWDFLQEVDKKYDYILIDVLSSSLKSSLKLSTSIQSVQRCKQILTKTGALHIYLSGDALTAIPKLRKAFPDATISHIGRHNYLFRW